MNANSNVFKANVFCLGFINKILIEGWPCYVIRRVLSIVDDYRFTICPAVEKFVSSESAFKLIFLLLILDKNQHGQAER